MSSFNVNQSVGRKPICKLLSARQRRIRIRQMQSILDQQVVALPSSASTSTQHIDTTVNLQDVASTSADYTGGIDGTQNVHLDYNSSSSSSSSTQHIDTTVNLQDVASTSADYTGGIDDTQNVHLDYNSSSSSSSLLLSSSEMVPETSFQERLASFCVDNSFTHTQGNNLLSLLRTHECFSHLPKDIRTVLHTPPTRVPTHVVEQGEYIHFNVEAEIVKYLNNASFQPDRELQLDFSTDGCALDKSGAIHLWPIQCMIRNIPDARPIVVGIYKGSQKPRDPNSFFNMFIMNLNEIISNGGINFHGTNVPIKLRSFIADAPARAFILNHNGHTSSRACSKCKVSGVQSNRRYVFNDINHPLRTDEDYSQCVDEDHHKEGRSPLSFLPFGMVSQVPFEYMHLVCLGVMKKVLSAWVSGRYSRSSKLPATHISIISSRLEKLKEFCPSEFGRRPRSLTYYSKYKAIEFRQFLLYIGPVVVYGLLHNDLYQHFLFLHAAIRILASESPSLMFLQFAEAALERFVLRTSEIYGPNFCTYNVHGLLHLTNDVKRLGPLDSFSVFPYENNMLIFRKFCRKPDLPLQQVFNRMAEIQKHGTNNVRRIRSSEVKVSMPFDILQYRKIQFNGMSFNIDVRDNCCILRDGAICTLCSIAKHESTFRIGVRKYLRVGDIFTAGLKSSGLGFFKCSLLSPEFYINPHDIRAKCFRMPFPGDNLDDTEEEGQERRGYAVVEMLHSDTCYN